MPLTWEQQAQKQREASYRLIAKGGCERCASKGLFVEPAERFGRWCAECREWNEHGQFDENNW